MSSFFNWLPDSGWSRLLCDALWQSTLIAGFGWLAARLLTRQSAARAWLLLLTLTACVLVPLASLAAREVGWTMLGRSGGDGSPSMLAAPTGRLLAVAAQWHPTVDDVRTAVRPNTDQFGAASADTLPALDTPQSRSIVLTTLAVIWLSASTLLALRLALSCVATWRLVRRATPSSDPALLAASAAATKRVGLLKPPAILLSGSVRTPTIFALGARRLLIPVDDTSRDDGKTIEWTAAFTHELAHAARRDGWARLWVELVLIALPLQPLVWLARRAFHAACEEACDDWAVATGTSPVDLAEILTTWIGNSKRRPTLLAIGMSSTKARTLRLLSLHTTPTAKLARRWRWAGACAAVLLVASLAIAQSQNDKKPDPRAANGTTTSAGDNKPAPGKLVGSSGKQTNAPPYVIEPPDILTISAVQLVPKESTRVAPLDKVRIEVSGTPPNEPIKGTFQIDSDGDVVLGPIYGAVKISDLTRHDAEEKVKQLLRTVLKEPHVALSIDETRREAGIAGDHLVGPDGKINLGIYGSVFVSGLTVADARAAVEKKLNDAFVDPKVGVDVSKYNSKVYYLITNEPGLGDYVRRMSTTGNETVMDAISEYQNSVNLPGRIKSITIARPSSASSKRETLEVHWKDVLHGDDTTNYQILPGDRIFIEFEEASGFGGGGASSSAGIGEPQPSKAGAASKEK
jgi:polysaccharide export outer membrane protein